MNVANGNSFDLVAVEDMAVEMLLVEDVDIETMVPMGKVYAENPMGNSSVDSQKATDHHQMQQVGMQNLDETLEIVRLKRMAVL